MLIKTDCSNAWPIYMADKQNFDDDSCGKRAH